MLTNSIVEVAGLCLPLLGIVAIALRSLGETELIVPGVTWFAFWQTQDALSSFIELAQAISCFAIAALPR